MTLNAGISLIVEINVELLSVKLCIVTYSDSFLNYGRPCDRHYISIDSLYNITTISYKNNLLNKTILNILNNFNLIMRLVMKDKSNSSVPDLFESHVLQSLLTVGMEPL